MLNQNRIANAIRFLAVDAVQQANSGHPGMPLGMADIATVLWREFLQHNPSNPKWLNRDRFVLSNGHGSMLLYALLHLTGYDLPLAELKKFRQLSSKTPGHPEFGVTPGVETTTGPLGQGLANAVGMALAEKVLAAKFNRPKFNIIDHYTYVFVGDGCLMEGISHEVCSFAGTHGLGKLIVFWDNNGISIDGNTSGWFTEDIEKRFHAYNWHVVPNIDGYNYEAIRLAIREAQAVTNKPSIICCKTIIGFGAPHMSNTHVCHGSPLGAQEVAAMRNHLGWSDSAFVIPDEIYAAWSVKEQGREREEVWQKLFSLYRKEYPNLAALLLRRLQHQLPENWQEKSNLYIQQTAMAADSLATRQASQKALNVYGLLLPELIGGSADLTSSNLTDWSGSKDITKDDPKGNYLHYGVREFGMFAMMNGLALYGGFIPYGGTFLVFASYGHSAIRMAAMMKLRVIYVFSHDSIGLGEDGPTHQPVEQLAMLRATPNLSVWRPSDATETATAWQFALERTTGPTALILTRQKVMAQKHEIKTLAKIKRGGYIVVATEQTPELIIIATGSELGLACKIAANLKNRGKRVQVVSMPSQDQFDRQEQTYRDLVLPPKVTKRVAIEAASSQPWHKYVGSNGKIIALDRYGESAPEKILFEVFGFSEENGSELLADY